MSKKITPIIGRLQNEIKIKGKLENEVKVSGRLTKGGKGDSAYDIWLKDGNTGTIRDFLNSTGDNHFLHNQTLISNEWIVNHGLNKFPSVTVVDSAETVVYGEVTYLSKNKVKINFSGGFSGKAYLN